MEPRSRILRTHGWHFHFHKKHRNCWTVTQISTVQLFSMIIHRPGRRILPSWSQHQRYNAPPPPKPCCIQQRWHLYIMFTRVPELCKVVGLTPQFRCMPQGMVYVISFIFPIKYSLSLTVPITKCNNCVQTARRLWNVLSSLLFYLTAFQRQRSYREKWQHVSDWRTYEGKQSSLVFTLYCLTRLHIHTSTSDKG
jgi:hypothetical protein